MHDRLRPGDCVGVGAPRNHFPLVPSEKYLFIAGGIGITPLLPMVRQTALLGADWQLLYSGRTWSSMALCAKLTAAYGERVHAIPQNELGLLDPMAWLGAPRPDTKVYCCGPAPCSPPSMRPAPAGRRTPCAPRPTPQPQSAPVRDTDFAPMAMTASNSFSVSRTSRDETVQMAHQRLGDLLDARVPGPLGLGEHRRGEPGLVLDDHVGIPLVTVGCRPAASSRTRVSEGRSVRATPPSAQ
ncbi:hypothetical protein ACIRJM_20915 [Streptomyces sp. NPDC102405]|uniref:hypothetical protein n=1 Tax=Streptomyces sp. NPDC102405 TaxID=3366170 RepID=UPI0038286763